MASQATTAEAAQQAIRAAIAAAGRGDAARWQDEVQRACELDELVADFTARAELAGRVRAQGIKTGMVSPIVNGAQVLAAAAAGGPFDCPPHLLELAIRRALDEAGCVDYVDVRELIFATTQCCGMLDLHDALLPPGWGWVIHLPLPEQP